MVFYNIFVSQMAIDPLEMVGQAIVRVPEIKPVVFNAGTKVPFPGNEKTMVVTEIIVKRIAAAEFGLFEIATQRVSRLIGEKVARIFFLRFTNRCGHRCDGRCGRRLRLVCWRAGEGRRDRSEEDEDLEFSNDFHMWLRRLGHRHIG